MSTSIVWAANGHELLKLEAGEDESAMKQRIQAAFGIPAGACRSADPSAVLSATCKGYHILRHSLCCTAAARNTCAMHLLHRLCHCRSTAAGAPGGGRRVPPLRQAAWRLQAPLGSRPFLPVLRLPHQRLQRSVSGELLPCGKRACSCAAAFRVDLVRCLEASHISFELQQLLLTSARIPGLLLHRLINSAAQISSQCTSRASSERGREQIAFIAVSSMGAAFGRSVPPQQHPRQSFSGAGRS